MIRSAAAETDNRYPVITSRNGCCCCCCCADNFPSYSLDLSATFGEFSPIRLSCSGDPTVFRLEIFLETLRPKTVTALDINLSQLCFIIVGGIANIYIFAQAFVSFSTHSNLLISIRAKTAIWQPKVEAFSSFSSGS